MIEKRDLQVGTVFRTGGYDWFVVVAKNFQRITPSVTVLKIGKDGRDDPSESNEVQVMFVPVAYGILESREQAKKKFPKRWNILAPMFPAIEPAKRNRGLILKETAKK